MWLSIAMVSQTDDGLGRQVRSSSSSRAVCALAQAEPCSKSWLSSSCTGGWLASVERTCESFTSLRVQHLKQPILEVMRQTKKRTSCQTQILSMKAASSVYVLSWSNSCELVLCEEFSEIAASLP